MALVTTYPKQWSLIAIPELILRKLCVGVVVVVVVAASVCAYVCVHACSVCVYVCV